MRDLLIITPTRQRQANAQRLIDAVDATATAQTDLILAVDDDDIGSYAGLRAGRHMVACGPRMTCIQWTNLLAKDYGPQYRTLASLGDDHVPETLGWDAALLGAIDAMGGTGIVYGNDTLQGPNLPTAPVVSSGIPAALGWFMYPDLIHFFADNVWKDLGERAGCLRYLPNVIIRHHHFMFGTAPADATYAEAAPAWAADEAAYAAWCRGAGPGDVEKVRKLCAGAS